MSVYVGIDVHRKRSQVAVVTEDGQVQRRLGGDGRSPKPVGGSASLGCYLLDVRGSGGDRRPVQAR